MPRYEFAEGGSNKFWEITLSGKSFTTTYGKIGTTGQTTIKSFSSDADAKKEHDKIVAEKVKKGYALAGGKAATGTPATGVTVAPKPAPAAAKPAAAKPAATAAKPGARYFEFSEGTSNKFWEVSLDGTSVRTRYGKLGTAGQITVKELSSKADAQKELDKLVAEKTKKGYAETTAGAAAKPATAPRTSAKRDGQATADARNPELEKAIVANPTDRDAYAIFADWLQEQGDPRGELISLQLGNRDKAAKQWIDTHADYFLGPLAEHQKTRDGLGSNSVSHLRTSAQEKEWQKTGEQAFLWRHGFIYRVRLSHDVYFDEAWKGKTADVLDQVLRHPSGRFVVEFSFQTNGDPSEGNLQDIIDLLSKKAPATTRKLTFGDNVDQVSWHHTGNLGKLWKAVPHLRVLEIETGEFDVGAMDAPELERAIFITGGLSKACGKNLAKAHMPKIQHLEIYYGDDNYGGDCSVKEVKPLLDRTDLPELAYLGLKNSMFSNDIAKAIGGAKILAGLETLDLSLGTMTDEGAEALAAAKGSLAHLECLDLTRNYLTKKGVAAVKGLCKKVVTDQQQEADDDGGDMHYYVSIAE
ncbi:MAG: WGR domain-containing protein [Kofleriaceae bacterium]